MPAAMRFVNVGEMRVMEGVDVLPNSQATARVTMISNRVTGWGGWPTVSARDREQQDEPSPCPSRRAGTFRSHRSALACLR